MSDDITTFQISQLNNQITRLANSIDKICERIARLEEDLNDRNIRKKIINVLLMLYPIATLFFMINSNNADYKKLADAVEHTQQVVKVLQ